MLKDLSFELMECGFDDLRSMDCHFREGLALFMGSFQSNRPFPRGIPFKHFPVHPVPPNADHDLLWIEVMFDSRLYCILDSIHFFLCKGTISYLP
ncbi:hypothetical protein TNIN_210401 [Trichonephila inaurata madagascariensis]|uniref:Uncharacterized protein n=1 Tax=Trichonephila inaurata madagascariensis TaxID=2747483 RepID=A0A8X6YML2_9ARAC|nr:hypothetical protein TNIN_210401 [Trichonephila inaurata madagascariensis]